MDLIKNWKLHLLALLIVIVAELIGMQRFDLIIFLPLFYALIIGGIISYPNFKILKLPEMERASRVLSIGMLILVTKLGLDIGPNLQQLMHASRAGVRPLLRHARFRSAGCLPCGHEARGHRRLLLDRP